MADGSKGRKVQRVQKSSSKTKVCNCSICEEDIKEPSNKVIGEDAVFCDGRCKSWVHRRCAGLTIAHFKIVSESNDPFLCPHCRLQENATEIALLKDNLAALTSEIASIKTQLSSAKPPNQPQQSQLSSSESSNSEERTPSSPTHTSSDKHEFDRLEGKFNLVVYGIPESPKGTKPNSRLAKDIENMVPILADLCPPISDQSIRDCVRLGRYTENKNRPILVKLSRACDAASILANRRKLSQHRHISIKPQMSPDERKIESLLLRERRSLILQGTDRKMIKIRNNRIYINKQLHGQVSTNEFIATNASTMLPHADTTTRSNSDSNATDNSHGDHQPNQP